MYKNKRVSVVIPTYNEAASIRGVVDGFFDTGVVDEVVVVDNNAIGNTKEEVAKTRARLVREPKQGYGHALMRGMAEAVGDLVVTTEADGTFLAKDIEKLLAYSDEFEAVFGTRTSRSAIWSGAFMPFPVRFGNWLWAKIIEVVFNGPVLTDVGCTYKLVSRNVLDKIKNRFNKSKGDGTFSPEFMIWILKEKISLIEVPVIYKERVGVSGYTGSISRASILGLKMLGLIFKYWLLDLNFFLKKYKTEFFIFGGTVLLNLSVLFFSSLRFSNDDQFILYRYIQNIALGKGFVYNLGEHVLGATTITFTLLAALLNKIFYFVPTPNLVAYLNIFLISVAAVLFFKVLNKFVNSKMALWGVFIFALNLTKIVPEGMESSLFILLTLALIYATLQNRHYLASVFLGLVILTRPDALLIALVVFVFWLKELGIQKTFRLTCVSILTTLPWLIFATFYFGSFIPQSLVAKLHTKYIVNQSVFQALKVQLAGLSRIYWGKIFDPNSLPLQVLFNLLPFIGLCVVGVVKKINRQNWFLFAFPPLYLVALSISNPVMFPWYLSELEPFWILVSFLGLAYLVDYFSLRPIKVLLMLVVIAGPLFLSINFIFGNLTTNKINLLNIGKYLKENVRPGDRVGVNNIGMIGFESGAYIVDFFGLVNETSPAFYPVTDNCRDQTAQYVIPPNLIMFNQPEWLVTNGDNELVECFRKSSWFQNKYTLQREFGGGKVFKLNK